MQIRSLMTGILCSVASAYATAQNVGIGTSTPERATLEQHGLVGNTAALFGAGANGIGLVASWPNLEFNAYYNQGHRYIGNGYAVVHNVNPNDGTMVFETDASGAKDALVTGTRPAMTIASNGRVGIGMNSGLNAQLNVGRDADKSSTAFFAAPQWSAFNYTSSEYTAIRSGANLTSLYLNYYAQYSKIAIGVDGTMVGINSGAPIYPLEIRAPDFCLALMRVGSLNQWIITVSQYYLKLFFRSTTANNTITQLGVFDYNSGQYSASSDRRMKKQIAPLSPALEKILQLQPCRYEMKYNNPGHDETIGLVAQDVKEIFPALVHVTQNANTGYPNIRDVHTLNYSGLAPIIIKALQEQQLQLAQLEERTAHLQNN